MSNANILEVELFWIKSSKYYKLKAKTWEDAVKKFALMNELTPLEESLYHSPSLELLGYDVTVDGMYDPDDPESDDPPIVTYLTKYGDAALSIANKLWIDPWGES
jgi:hypothetical protein